MKQTLTILILLLIFYGCKKDNNEPDSPTTTGSFIATVNGVTITADSARGYLHIENSTVVPMRVFILEGHTKNRQVVPTFADLINSTGLIPANYDSIEAGAGIQYYDMNDSINEFDELSAFFKITSVDTVNKKISGNFNGVLVADVSGDTIVVTNGIFTNINYEIW